MMKPIIAIPFSLLLFFSGCAGGTDVGSTAGITSGGMPAVTSAQTQPIPATVPRTTRPAQTQPPATTSGSTESKFAQFHPVGKKVSVDLNGDGKKEDLYYGMDDFTIEGKSFKQDILYSIDIEGPDTDVFLITDIDRSTKQKEIGIMLNGASDDYEVFFFKYDKKKLTYIGRVPSIIEDLGATFDGEGHIKGNMRLQILQTWFAPATWELTESNQIQLVPEEMYYPVEFSWQEQVGLNESLPIYKEPGDPEPIGTIEPQDVRFLATDNDSWVEIEGEDGVKGWFKVDNFDEIVDLEKPAGEVFSNLFLAD